MIVWMVKLLLVLLCWANSVRGTLEDASVKCTDFMAVYNGNFDNIEQLTSGEGSDKLEVRFKPVLVPVLQKDPMIYAEEAVNGTVFRMWVGRVTLMDDGDTISISRYNFTNPFQYKPGTFNTDELASLPRNAFNSHEDCDGSFRKLTYGEYIGMFPDCTRTVNQQHPDYTLSITCKGIFGTSSVESLETTTKTLLALKFKGPRYTVIAAPKGYVSPCSADS